MLHANSQSCLNAEISSFNPDPQAMASGDTVARGSGLNKIADGAYENNIPQVPRQVCEEGWLGSNHSEPPAAGGSASLRPQPPRGEHQTLTRG